jgi:hypothetical protein
MILPVEIKEEEKVLQFCENGPKMYVRTKFLYNSWDIEEIRFLCEKVGKKIQEGLVIYIHILHFLDKLRAYENYAQINKRRKI